MTVSQNKASGLVAGALAGVVALAPSVASAWDNNAFPRSFTVQKRGQQCTVTESLTKNFFSKGHSITSKHSCDPCQTGIDRFSYTSPYDHKTRWASPYFGGGCSDGDGNNGGGNKGGGFSHLLDNDGQPIQTADGRFVVIDGSSPKDFG